MSEHFVSVLLKVTCGNFVSVEQTVYIVDVQRASVLKASWMYCKVFCIILLTEDHLDLQFT